MIKRFLLVVPVLLGLILLLNTKEKGAKINGVNLVSPSQKVDSLDFSRLNRINTGWVGIIPYGFSKQGDPKVIFDQTGQWWGERSEGTRDMINLAHINGYKVMLKPHVWMRGGWIGDFELTTEADWQHWEAEYEKYILNFATIAEDLKVAMFCIGTEYKIAVIKRPAFWYRLIEKVKKIYSGEVTYASNWDNYENIIFWNKLDYIGVDSYFPLVNERHPTIESMELAWEKKTQDLKRISDKFDRPILFTEFGYQSVNGAAGEHWTVNKDHSNINMQLQSDAYQCLFNTVWSKPWMAGGFLWKWHLHDNRGGIDNPDWTPQKKPAEGVISRYYAQ